METFETEVNLERTREVMKSCIRAAPRPTIQAMSQRLKRRTHLRIVETRTIPDGFSCQGAGSKFQRKLEPVQIKIFKRGAIPRGLQSLWPEHMHLRLRLAGLLTHDCSSMRATRATRASLMARQFNLIRLKPFHVAKMRMLTVPMF
jgi:hypothetical protein